MPETNKITLITAENLRAAIENNPELIVINVLSESYFDDCHIKGSINIPFDRLLAKTASWDKEKDIAVYCATPACNKSKNACFLLQDLGFHNVHEYIGGIQEWKKKGFETVGPCALDYLRKQ